MEHELSRVSMNQRGNFKTFITIEGNKHNTYFAWYNTDAQRALPDPVGIIPIGILIAFSQSSRCIKPCTT